jgi:hypothetical protein
MIDVEKILKDKFSDIRFEIIQRDKFKIIYLTGFIVPINLRNTGIGTNFMNELCKIADEIGYKITLTPSSAYDGNLNRLLDFYSRFGFVLNSGKNRDYTHREKMYREPKNSDMNEENTTTTSSTAARNGCKCTGEKSSFDSSIYCSVQHFGEISKTTR